LTIIELFPPLNKYITVCHGGHVFIRRRAIALAKISEMQAIFTNPAFYVKLTLAIYGITAAFRRTSSLDGFYFEYYLKNHV
jgi:hypothetical protein